MYVVSRGQGPLKERYRPRKLSECAPTFDAKRVANIGTVLASRVVMFEGPPGTGKSTTARIMARTAVCMAVPHVRPCLTCVACQVMEESLDYSEINTADFRKIDDIREFVPTLNYRPMTLRRRVVILDEVHQLTADAQQVLLKALEDPPDYVLIFLCTTQTKGINKALLQRCERFVFNPLNEQPGVGFLLDVAEAENKSLSEDTARQIYEAAGGSPREMLNLLQGVFDGGALDAMPEAEEGSDDVKALFDALNKKNWPAASGILSRPSVKAKPEATRIGVENYVRAVLLKSSKPTRAHISLLACMAGSLSHEPVQISQYNLFVLKCLHAVE